MLGHSQPATTHRYAHLSTSPLRAAADSLGVALSVAMGEGPASQMIGDPDIPLIATASRVSDGAPRRSTDDQEQVLNIMRDAMRGYGSGL